MSDKFLNMNLTPTSKKISYLLDSSNYQGINLSGFVAVKEEVQPSIEDVLADKLKAEKQKLLTESEKLATMGSQLALAISSFMAEKDEYFVKLKKEATLLAMTVAKKIVGEELKGNPLIAENCIRTILEEIDASEKKSLEVNTADWELLSNTKADFVNTLKGEANLEIKISEEVPSGVIRLVMENQALETGPSKKIDHLWMELVAKGYVKEEVKESNESKENNE